MRRSTAVAVTALGGIVAGVLVFLLVLSLARSGRATSHLGSRVFVVGGARGLAVVVDRSGPLLFQDLLGHDHDLYVQHLPYGWRAFEAHAPGAPRRCQVRWRKASVRFVDPCSGRSFPADGAGLRQYRVVADAKGRLVVDLAAPGR